MSKFGDAVFVFGMFVWLTVAVGPWWVGLALFVVAYVLNWFTRKWKIPA